MANILVVHDDPTPSADDTNLINFLTGRGHTVATASETATLPNSGHDVVIVTESGSSSSTAIGSIPTCSLPVMIFETTWNTALISSAACTTGGSGTQYDLTAHAVNSGYSNPLSVYATSKSMYGTADTNLPSGVTVLAYVPGTSHATAVFAESGATLTSGTAANRRCGIGLVSSRLTDIVTVAGDWFEDVVLLTAGTGGGGGTNANVSASTISRAAVIPNRTPTISTGSQIQFKWGTTSYTNESFPTASTFFMSHGGLSDGDYVTLFINSPQSVLPNSVPSGFDHLVTYNNTHGYLILYDKLITDAASEPSSWQVGFPQAIEGGMIALCYSGTWSIGWQARDSSIDSSGTNTSMTAPNIGGLGKPGGMVIHVGITNDYPFDFGTQVSSTSEANVPSGAGPLNTRTKIDGNDVGNGQAWSIFTYDRSLGSAAEGADTGSLTMNYLSSLASIAVTVKLDPAINAAVVPATLNRTASFGAPTVAPAVAGTSPATISRTVAIATPTVSDGAAKNLPAYIGADNSNVEQESHSYNPIIIDTNGNLYTITESTLAENNQPRAMKSTDGGQTWTEMDAANRPGTDTGGIGDLESGWITYETGGFMTFTWQRSYTVWVRFRTSDHPTNPDTWQMNTRNQVISGSGSPQFASHTSPTDQNYSWVVAAQGDGTLVYAAVTKTTGFGNSSAVFDSATTCSAPMAYLDANNVSHVLYKKAGQLHHRRIDWTGADANSTRVDTNGVNAQPIPHARPVPYIINTVTIVTCIFTNASGHLKAVDIVDGVPGSEQTITTDPVLHNPGTTGNEAAVVSADVDGSKMYVFWADSATGNIMFSTREYGGTWSTPDAHINQPSTDCYWIYVKVNEYPNGDRVLSIRYADGFDVVNEINDIYYDELVLPGSGGPQVNIGPGTISRSAFLTTPTVSTSGIPATTITRTASFPARTISAGTMVLAASIATIAGIGNVPPNIIAPEIATPNTINRTVIIPDRTPIAGQGATLAPSSISRTVTITGHTAFIGVSISSSTLSRTVTFPARTVGASVAATPAVITTLANVTVFDSDFAALNAKAEFYEAVPSGSIVGNAPGVDIVNAATPVADIFNPTVAAEIET